MLPIDQNVETILMAWRSRSVSTDNDFVRISPSCCQLEDTIPHLSLSMSLIGRHQQGHNRRRQRLTQAKMTLVFKDEDGAERSYQSTFPVGRGAVEQGERRLLHEITADLIVATQDRAKPKHNRTSRAWLEFPGATYDFAVFDDVYNSQELWRELCNLVLSVEHDLVDANGYKDLEPTTPPQFEDDDAIEGLYHLHRRKMEHFNRAVYQLIKVQDLVNRLIHEALGGDLVSTNFPTWESDQLLRANVMKGIERKASNGELSVAVRNAIVDALALPNQASHHDVVMRYRNRLTHHVNPSVDYGIFYAKPRSREPEPIRDANGQITSWVRTVYGRPPIDFTFSELNRAYTEYLDAVVAMLDRLAVIESLRR